MYYHYTNMNVNCFIVSLGNSLQCVNMVCMCVQGSRATEVLPAEECGAEDSDARVITVRLRLHEKPTKTAASRRTATIGEEPQHGTL